MLLSRRIALALVVAIAAVMMAMMVSADLAEAKHGDVHQPQPFAPPGDPDSGIHTGRGN